MQFSKTRIAPTPSGFLHLGNAYSFAVTAALAHKYRAAILLRIDDLDHERVRQEYVQDIFDTLRFLHIDWSEGPTNVQELGKNYSQACRLPLYQQALDQLRNDGELFACTCSRTQVPDHGSHGYPGTCLNKNLPFDVADICWRLRTGPIRPLRIKILSGAFVEATLPRSMQHFIVRKKDGLPSYQLASLIDDLHFQIDLVVRGEDLWNSTLAQQYLAQALGTKAFENIAFVHHRLLTADGKKLSKSAGATSMRHLRKANWQGADVYNELSRLAGWDMPIQHWKELVHNTDTFF